MQPKTILKQLQSGNKVIYTIRRLRGYLHGDASLEFHPQDAKIGENNIAHRLKCFRNDEKPYDNARWETKETDKFYKCCVCTLPEHLEGTDSKYPYIDCPKDEPVEFPYKDMVYYKYVKGVMTFNHIDPITGDYDDSAYIPVLQGQ